MGPAVLGIQPGTAVMTWRHDIEMTLSLLALCERNVIGKGNRPISQIPKCIRQISHIASFWNINMPSRVLLCYEMVHCRIWIWCIVTVREQFPSFRFYCPKIADRENGEKRNRLFHHVMSGIISCGWHGKQMYYDIHVLHALCHVVKLCYVGDMVLCIFRQTENNGQVGFWPNDSNGTK